MFQQDPRDSTDGGVQLWKYLGFAKKLVPEKEKKNAPSNKMEPWLNERGKKMSFAARLKISRKEKGYSQETLAEELEVSRQSITKWETGTAFPELKKLLQLSVKLDKDLDWLLCDERNELIPVTSPDTGDLYRDRRIYDRESLEGAVRDRRICGILQSLNGTEFRESIEEDGFAGVRSYTIFGCRMYSSSSGMNPRTGEAEEIFTELKPVEAVEVLLRRVRQFRLTKG